MNSPIFHELAVIGKDCISMNLTPKFRKVKPHFPKKPEAAHRSGVSYFTSFGGVSKPQGTRLR